MFSMFLRNGKEVERATEIIKKESDEESESGEEKYEDIKEESGEKINQIKKDHQTESTVMSKPSGSKHLNKMSDEDNTNLADLIKLLALKFAKDEGALKVEDVENTIPDFDGKSTVSVEKWFENFEKSAEAYKWTEMQKYVIARNKMKDTAKLFLQSISVCDYGNLKQEIVSEFHKELSSAQIHKQLQERRKKDNESSHEYILQMRKIGFLGNMDDKSIIEYIVDGVNGKPEHKIGLYSAKSFSELKEQFEIYDRIQKSSPASTSRSSFQTTSKKEHCYNCGSYEHKRSECKSSAKCFKCNAHGHISTNCTYEPRHTDVPVKKQVNVAAHRNMLKVAGIDGIFFKCLIDGGAEVTLMKESIFMMHYPKKQLLACTSEMIGLGGAVTKPKGQFSGEIKIDELFCSNDVIVVPDSCISQEVILGFDFISKFRYTSDENGYTFHSLVPRVEEGQEIQKVMNIHVGVSVVEIVCPPQYQRDIEKMKNSYVPNERATSPIEMKIVLEKEEPVYSSPSRLPPPHQDIVREQVLDWMKCGIIRPSSSQYCSRVVLADKKDKSKRVCIDYRRINKLVFKDRYPVPNMEDVVDKLSGCSIYSVLDIKNAFLHVPIEESSRKYTAFVTKEGMFEFNFAPFGFCNSPAVFIRFINYIFRDLINESIMEIYMDDIVIFSKDEVDGMRSIVRVIKVASENGLQINWSKCKFLQTKVEFLGLIIQGESVSPSNEKIKAVKNFAEPKNIKDLQSFLGLTGFFRKFVERYALISKPLTDLLKKDVVFKIKEEHRHAIDQLKTKLTSEPTLRIYSRNAKTELHTDASKDGFGAILMQEFEDVWYPVYFWSKKTTEAESKLHSFHLEIKAAFLAMKKMRHYLMGLVFGLFTDCAAFQYTSTKEELPTSVSRYVMYMQDFNFSVIHRKGTQMRHVDALSRYAVMIASVEDDLSSRLKRAQRSDDHILAILEILKSHPYENFKLINNVLFKEEKGLDLLVVPKLMEKEIITKLHEKGHFSTTKTMHRIQQTYFIAHLEHKVDTIIKNCIECILYNKKLGRQEGFLHCIDKGNLPLMKLHIDHLGPMDITCKMYKHLFAFVDGFSKFVWLYPTKSTGAEEVLAKLNNWKKIFGNPETIVSDKGAAFTSNSFKEYCREGGIEHVENTTGVPRGNGQIERVNRTIIPILSKLSSDNPSKWYKHVDDVQRAINSSIHRSTKVSPFEILFGVKMRSNDIESNIAELLEQQLVEEFDAERNKLRQDAKLQIEKVQQEYKKTFDKKRKPDFGYKLGDFVAIKRTQFVAGKKLKNQFLGPYEITKVNRHGRYEVRKVAAFEGPNITSTSNDYMKLWKFTQVDEDLSSGTDEESDDRM